MPVAVFSLDEVRRTVEDLEVQLKETCESMLSAEERSVRLEKTLQAEEQYQAKMLVELKELGEVQFRRSKELENMKSEKRNLETAMQVLNII